MSFCVSVDVDSMAIRDAARLLAVSGLLTWLCRSRTRRAGSSTRHNSSELHAAPFHTASHTPAPQGPTPIPFKTTKKFSPFRFLSFSSPLNNANFHILGTCFNAIYEVPGCLRSRLWPTTQIVGFRTEWRETESDFGARSWVRFFPARRGKGRNDWTYISAFLDSILCLACSGCA